MEKIRGFIRSGGDDDRTQSNIGSNVAATPDISRERKKSFLFGSIQLINQIAMMKRGTKKNLIHQLTTSG